MDTNHYSPFGVKTMSRLDAIGKDKAWLLEQLKRNGSYVNRESLERSLTGETVSRSRECLIGIILHEEEERQRLKKIAGVGE